MEVFQLNVLKSFSLAKRSRVARFVFKNPIQSAFCVDEKAFCMNNEAAQTPQTALLKLNSSSAIFSPEWSRMACIATRPLIIEDS
jgi:hypothetical protein